MTQTGSLNPVLYIMGYIRVIPGVYWGSIRIMKKKMETTLMGLYRV